VEFRDFLEPNLMKTGHLLPLRTGHNGGMNRVELALYEIHLTNAGFGKCSSCELVFDPSTAE
jgi:hypothetical protein